MDLALNSISITSGLCSAEICLTGGEVTQWRVDQTDLLWKPDPTYWRRTSPILFPVVGWLNNNGILIHGRRRLMTVHGFAKTTEFAVVERSEANVTIELRSSTETVELYPFNFRLRVHYSLASSALHVDADVFNEGPGPMPYGFGLHPGFCWPLPGTDGEPHTLTFSARESDLIPLVTQEGYICHERRRLSFDGTTLLLEPALFENDVLCFLNARSSSIVFSDGRKAALTVSSNNFPHWGIWSKLGANFLCIQSWTSYGDPPGFAGSIYDKPSMLLLPAGESRRHSVTWEYQVTL